MARRRDTPDFLEQFSAVRKRITAVAAQAYATVELGSMQARVLRHIGGIDGATARISQAALARAIESDPTLTGRTLQTLIERGLIRRERSDQDRREYMLELTSAGRRARDRVVQLRAGLITQLGEALDDRDLDDFDRIVAKIMAAFDPPAAAE